MASLKSYTPALADILGTTASALYERQRALVRSGLLASESGRGPGSGVRATSPAVGLLLIAILATDSLSETGDLAGAFAAATSTEDVHPFNSTKTLVDTLAFFFNSRVWSSKLMEVSVIRSHGVAVIRYRDSGKNKTAEFRINGQSPSAALRIEASISGDVIRQITKDILAIGEAK